MTRPAITFVIRSLDAGGAERQLVELATGLHCAGWRVTVITFYPHGVLEERLHQADIPVVCLEKRGRWDFVSLWRLARYVKASAPDVLHGYLPVPNILVALLRPDRHTRVVWGIRASNMELDRYNWLWRIEFAVAAALSHCADLIIANSVAGHAYHADRGYPRAKMIVIPNGVDLQHFRPDAETRRQLRKEWRVPADDRVVGLVGRIDAMKDHANFLRAAAEVLQARADVRFVCVGAGDARERQKLERLAVSLGLGERLSWLGLRTDVWRIYNALDLVVSSSAFGEGFPNVIAEAMATGIRCVVTDVGDSGVVVGDQGWVCAPRDSAALARAILAGLESSACDAASVRERVRRNFSSQALVDRTDARLRALLGATAASAKARPSGLGAVERSRET